MSLGDIGADDHNCGHINGDVLHMAVCASVAAGVTYTVSAGNDATDASTQIPAAYSEVITASAYSDSDGRPGGLGPEITQQDCGIQSADDVFAFFSNFGPAVDLAAPGVCISTTSARSNYASLSGTSFSAPHVAGAVALLNARHPGGSPAQVKAKLSATADPGPIPEDPDAYPEGIVNVRGY